MTTPKKRKPEDRQVEMGVLIIKLVSTHVGENINFSLTRDMIAKLIGYIVTIDNRSN